MLTAIREVQIPLLAAVLLGACAAKVWKALRPHADGRHSDPSALFPAHLRRPIMALGVRRRLGLGLGPDRTALRLPGTGLTDARLALPATVVRTGTALFFPGLGRGPQRDEASAPGCGLRLLRRTQRHSDRVAHDRPGRPAVRIGRRYLRLPSLRMPSSSTVAELWLAVLAFELALLAFRSPSSARSWSGSAIRAVRGTAHAGRADHERPLTPARSGASTRARSPPGRRRTSGAKDAGGSWCTRYARGRGSISSSPSTCRTAGRGPRRVLVADTDEVLNQASTAESCRYLVEL